MYIFYLIADDMILGLSNYNNAYKGIKCQTISTICSVNEEKMIRVFIQLNLRHNWNPLGKDDAMNEWIIYFFVIFMVVLFVYTSDGVAASSKTYC